MTYPAGSAPIPASGFLGIDAILCTDPPERAGLYVTVEPAFKIAELSEKVVQEMICGRMTLEGYGNVVPPLDRARALRDHIAAAKQMKVRELIKKAMARVGYQYAQHTDMYMSRPGQGGRVSGFPAENMQLKIVTEEEWNFMLGLAACELATRIRI
jgi:hypothetical protein